MVLCEIFKVSEKKVGYRMRLMRESISGDCRCLDGKVRGLFCVIVFMWFV